jgi:membrane protease YdiL (CAAX protease family)
VSGALNARANESRFWYDWPFYLAVLLGPTIWLMLIVLQTPLRQGPTPWESLIWIGIVYPILEEYVFRGGLQAALYRRVMFARSVLGLSVRVNRFTHDL